MGFALIKKNSPKNGYDSHAIVEIMIDTKEDLQSLPVGFDAGSIAYTADRSVTATLNTKGEWIEHVGENGGGSGGGIFVVNAVVDEDANTLTVDKTLNEITDAYDRGMMVIMRDNMSGSYTLPVRPSETEGSFCSVTGGYAGSNGWLVTAIVTIDSNGVAKYANMSVNCPVMYTFPEERVGT